MNPGIPDIPRPPHDPLFTYLDARVGWRASRLDDVELSGDGAMQLKTPPPAQQKLADGSGAFGGLALPTGTARDSCGNLFRLDAARSLIERFDPCEDRFDVVPCTGGIGSAPRQLKDAHGLAFFGGDVFVCDTGNQRVQIFRVHGWTLRAIWSSPTGSPWQPFGIAFDPLGRAFISDRLNGVVHCFDRQGRKLLTFGTLQRPTHVTIDRAGRIYVVQEGLDDVAVFEADGTPAQPQPFVRYVSEVKDRFCPVEHDETGTTMYVTHGTFVSEPLDSGIDQCVWHRIVVNGEVPRGTQIRIDTYTSDTAFGPDITDDAAPGWVSLPPATQTQSSAWDALIVSAAGRFLWLRVRLIGHGTTTPRLRRIRIEYPRVSLRRWLPAVFGANPRSADFTDRLLAVFDTIFRGIEAKLDAFGRYLDPLGAPADKGSRADWLAWLASWLDLTLDRTWPEERRRRWLREAASLYQVRGTTEGLRRQLLLLLGWTGPAAQAPALILEHFKLRRWLFVGRARLGEQAILWGEQLLGCPTADADLRLGTSVLPLPGPGAGEFVEQHAYRFTVFVPVAAANDPALRSALERVVAFHEPAHTVGLLEPVAPRCRIGSQCSVGLNTVVGRYPNGFRLPAQRLGQDSVLADEGGAKPALRVGAVSRVGSTTVLS